MKYDKPTEEDIYRAKDTYYCTPYDSCDVNDKWAKQVIENTTTSEDDGTSTIDASKITEKNSIYNISAKMENFGKYGASFELSCFYGSYSKTTGNDVKCYKNNDGKETSCVDDTGKQLPEGKSTKLQDNYDIRISDNASIFPQKNGKNRLRGYNWGRQARLKSKDSTIQDALYQTGYGVDPVEYSKAVMKQEEDENSIYNSDPDLTITISKNRMKKLKSDNVKLDLDGTYSENEVIPGLRYYKMGTITDYVTINKGSNWNLGNNSKTAKEVARQ